TARSHQQVGEGDGRRRDGITGLAGCLRKLGERDAQVAGTGVRGRREAMGGSGRPDGEDDVPGTGGGEQEFQAANLVAAVEGCGSVLPLEKELRATHGGGQCARRSQRRRPAAETAWRVDGAYFVREVDRIEHVVPFSERDRCR